MALRIVMMGTGDFALPTFRALLDGRHAVAGLFTQPDRAGRGHHRHRNALKELAIERGIAVFQPESVNRPEALNDLRSLRADAFVVAAYGQILSDELLRIPRLGAINVHASLLPKFRGAAPIQTAILQGETETGVTIFRIEPKLDAGPILAIERTPIGPRETSGALEERLAVLGARLALRVLDELESGTATPIPQDAARASRAPRLKKESGRIDWTRSGRQIDCQVRAMQPWPLADTFLAARGGAPPLRLIVLAVDPAPSGVSPEAPSPPGTILPAEPGRLIVQTGAGPVEILRLRPEGKRDMAAAEFLRGRKVEAGDRLESPGERTA